MFGRHPDKKYFTQKDIMDAVPDILAKAESGTLKPGKPAPTYIEGTDLVMEFDDAEDAMTFYVAMTMYMNMEAKKLDISRPQYGGASGLPN